MSITLFVPRAIRIGFSDKDRQRRTVAVIDNGIIGHGVAQASGQPGRGAWTVGRSQSNQRSAQAFNSAMAGASSRPLSVSP